MNISIIGTDSMALGIGTRLLAGGHSVTLIGRDLAKAIKLAKQLNDSTVKGAAVTATQLGNPLSDKVIVLAIPYHAVEDVLQQYGEQFSGKIIIDITNPLNDTFDGLVTKPDSSAAEEIAKNAPKGTKVIKAFNTTFARTLVNGNVAGHSLDVFIAGDDSDAKAVVTKLITDGGLRAIDTGPLYRARQLEAMGLLGIILQKKLETGFMSAWKILW